jgi:hypothetical protein
MPTEGEFITNAISHTSTALVPLSIKSSFVTTPKVLSPYKCKRMSEERKLGRLMSHENKNDVLIHLVFHKVDLK